MNCLQLTILLRAKPVVMGDLVKSTLFFVVSKVDMNVHIVKMQLLADGKEHQAALATFLCRNYKQILYAKKLL